MATRLTIDPVTRIEGHLRVDVEVDGGQVNDAWSSCTMWRGIENILKERDAREAWLFTQRFCGVCTTVHAISSVRAVEDATNAEIPPNAQFIRNLILIAHALHDHIVHFYHLSALDWVDVTTVPQADPAKAAAIGQTLSDWPGNSVQEMQRVKDTITGFVQRGQLGIFTNGYWGHPAMRLPPEVNLLAVAHYLQALDVQRVANQVVGILGGKTPHIQNVYPGGVQNAINLDSMGAMNMDRLYAIKGLLDQVIPFVQNVYLTDVAAVAANYMDWFGYGGGSKNYLAVPDLPTNGKATAFDLPGGVIVGGDLANMRVIKDWKDAEFRKSVTEDTEHSYYESYGPLHPWKGKTDPKYNDWNPEGKYSWVKAPRYNGLPMEVGPLAQVLVGFASGHELTVKWVTKAVATVEALANTKVQPAALMSTLGRHAARAVRASMLADLATKHWELLANNILGGDSTTFEPPTYSGEVEGVGLHEAPRGTLSHWVVLDGSKIKNYQAVVPTTWNASPRDKANTVAPYEAALIGNPVADPKLPLEVIRTLHSFDPCMACACHTFDPEGNELGNVSVLG